MPFTVSLWHKDRWLPCTEIIYCRAYRSNITTQPKKGKPGYLPEVLHHVLHYEPPLPLGEAGGEVTGEADPNCLTGITKQRLELLSSYWSSSYITALSLVESFMRLLRQLSYTIKNQFKTPKAFLPFPESLWYKDAL